MGCYQTEQPALGKEGVGPSPMIEASAATFDVDTLAKSTPQTHAHPFVELDAGPLIAVF
jgi:hypothetical protein